MSGTGGCASCRWRWTENKILSVNYDLSTIGGLNQKNFADVVEWWAFMLGQLNKFFDEHPGEK